MFLCKKRKKNNKWNNQKKKKKILLVSTISESNTFCVCPLVTFSQSSVTAAAFKWYLVFSIRACSDLNVTKNRFWQKKKKALICCSACSFELQLTILWTGGWAFVQQNCFPPAERALVLEIACFILRLLSSGNALKMSFLYFLCLKRLWCITCFRLMY